MSAKVRIKLKPYNIDGWANMASGAGFTDKSRYDNFAYGVRLDQFTLDNLYANDWLARKICEKPAKDATRKGILIRDDKKANICAELERIGFSSKLRDSISWGRLYGGSAMIFLVDDGLDPSEPLNPSKVKKLYDVMIIDRNYMAAEGIDTDPSSVNYGLPSHYRINGGELFHISRIAKFTGARLTFAQRMSEQGWGGSYVQLYWDALKSFQMSMSDLRHIMTESSLGVLSVPHLTNAAAMGGKAWEAVNRRAEQFNLAKSLYRTAVLDKEEDYQYVNRSLAGLSDLADRFMTVVSGATDLPQLILFGTTPGGLNASQDEQMESYYDTVTSVQEDECTPAYNTAIACITGGQAVDWEYKPLAQLNDAKAASVRLQEAQAISAIAEQAGLTPEAIVDHLNNTGHFNLPVQADDEALPEEAEI